MGGEKNMSSITLKVNVFKEGDVYVALCPMLNVSSFGDDIEHAKRSLKEALEAFLEECEAMGTLEEVLEETGFVKKKTTWVSEEPIMEEKIAISC
jgi:predicted RNase H-like HicB family nuclease